MEEIIPNYSHLLTKSCIQNDRSSACTSHLRLDRKLSPPIPNRNGNINLYLSCSKHRRNTRQRVQIHPQLATRQVISLPLIRVKADLVVGASDSVDDVPLVKGRSQSRQARLLVDDQALDVLDVLLEGDGAVLVALGPAAVELVVLVGEVDADAVAVVGAAGGDTGDAAVDLVAATGDDVALGR